MDSAASPELGSQSQPVAPLPRWVEDAREVVALVSGLITEHQELRNAVDALQRERDDLRGALKRLRQEHERQVWLQTSVEEHTGVLLAEIKQLVAEAKQKRRVAQDTSPFAPGPAAPPVTEHQAPAAFQDVQLPGSDRPDWLGDLRALLAEVAAPRQGPIEAERLRALREMSGELAHDLSNILTGILGRIQLLVSTVSDADLRRQLRMIEQVASEGAWIVQCLHEFGRTRLTRLLEQVDVNRLVDEMALLARSSWGEQMSRAGKRGEVKMEAVPVPTIRGDAVELRKALSSVVLGALDAMPDGGELAFRTGVDGNAVVCVVAHSGLRLEEEDRVRAFEPVFGTRREKRKGPDLSAAYAAVRRHGGDLSVLSHSERGAAFAIRLPVDGPPTECVPEPEHKSAIPVEAGRTGTARILVIDDSAEVRELLGDLLRQHGYIVVRAEDGESDLVEAEAQTFSLALVDIGLPGISGVEVATRIKRRWPKTTVVLMTGYTDRIGGPEAKEQGIDAVLTKPFTLDQVTSLAERALARGNGSAFRKPNQAPPSLAAEISEEPPIVERP